MIPLGPVTSSAGTTYTAAQVQSLLFSPTLAMRWWFDLLAPQLAYKADLTALVDWSEPPIIEHDSGKAVKRSLQLKMRASSAVNPLQDLVRVRFEVGSADGGWLDWVVGTYMFTPPVKEIIQGHTWWRVTAPDLSQLLSDAAFSVSTSFAAGTDYIGAVAQLAGSYGGLTPLQVAIPSPLKTLPAALGWDAGTSYLRAVNDLVGAVVYIPAWLNGASIVSMAQPDYTQVGSALTLDTIAGQAQVTGPFNDVPDYSNAYNQFLVTGQDPRRQPVSAYYENTRADSPVSLRNWHPRLLVINDSSLADEASCQLRALYEAQVAARIYSTLTVGMVPWPYFEDLDVVTLAYSSTDEGVARYSYLVVGFTHTCHSGTPTTVKLQRVVPA